MIEVVNFKNLTPEIKEDLTKTENREFEWIYYAGRKMPKFGLKESFLANQFKGKDSNMLLNEYRNWINGCIENENSPDPLTQLIGYLPREEIKYLTYLNKQHGKLWLVCWCAPNPCHCDIIKEIIEDRIGAGI